MVWLILFIKLAIHLNINCLYTSISFYQIHCIINHSIQVRILLILEGVIMTKDEIFASILSREGGYVDHPDDRGDQRIGV